LNSTYIDTRHLEKDRDALNFKKKKMKQRLYKQEAYEKKAEKEKGKDDNDKLAKKRQKK
jgi:predicted ATP-grasp superfamily ATP-dependent carboligase